jgi:hypothetical protein
MFDINQLCEDLRRIVWYEYIDRLRVRMLHYQLTRKFRHWRYCGIPALYMLKS